MIPKKFHAMLKSGTIDVFTQKYTGALTFGQSNSIFYICKLRTLSEFFVETIFLLFFPFEKNYKII